MKKEKLDLNGLKVQSFVTATGKNAARELKGGTDPNFCEPTDPDPCGTTGCTRWSDCACPPPTNTTCGQTRFCSADCSFDVSGPCAC